MAWTREERLRIARATRAAGAQLRNEPLPPSDQLARLSLQEMLDLLASYGVTLDEERMDVEVRGALARELLAINRGDPLDPARVEALKGRAQRLVAQTARSVANQTIGDMRQVAILDADPRPDDDRWYMWVTASGKEHSCPDCHDRHGIVARMDWWENAGMPRDGMTVCGGNCKCRLVMVSAPPRGVKDEGKTA